MPDASLRELPDAGPNEEGGGRLSENIMHFARVLRRAGLAIGPGQVLQALNSVGAVGLDNREDFYWTLHAVFVNRRDQRELFDQAFHIFWRNPDILGRMMSLMLPEMGAMQDTAPKGEEMSRRLAEALNPGNNKAKEQVEDEEITLDATLTWSANEVLAKKDFEKMSSEEIRAAVAAIQRMRLPAMEVKTRRYRASLAGNRVDMRRTLRAALRGGQGYIPLMKREKRVRRPPLVILCDISGSMERYSRMLLHFLHAVTNDRDRVFTFLFGTRLTNVTRYLRYKDVDEALARCGDAVNDWSGGTRIGHSLHEFNQYWSRRVLTQGAVVLMISDGLDRDEAAGLTIEMERLHKSCRRLIWLNPLLRFEGFQPKSVGIRAILPHVDEFRTIHNLESMRELVQALSLEAPRRQGGMRMFKDEAA